MSEEVREPEECPQASDGDRDYLAFLQWSADHLRAVYSLEASRFERIRHSAMWISGFLGALAAMCVPEIWVQNVGPNVSTMNNSYGPPWYLTVAAVAAWVSAQWFAFLAFGTVQYEAVDQTRFTADDQTPYQFIYPYRARRVRDSLLLSIDGVRHMADKQARHLTRAQVCGMLTVVLVPVLFAWRRVQ